MLFTHGKLKLQRIQKYKDVYRRKMIIIRVQRKRTYRDGVPLESSPHRLISPINKCAHILGQEETVDQALGNTTPFLFLPTLDACASQEGRAV